MDEVRQSQMGIAASLSKPVSQSRLLEGLMKVLPEAGTDPSASVNAEELPEGEARRGLRILIAEDVLENQALIEGLLERFGHSLVMVANGRAVDAFDKEFDVIENQALIDGGRTPIIALTAHAMKGAGKVFGSRDGDYVTKPIRGKLLSDSGDSSRSVVMVANGREAVDAFDKEEFDVIDWLPDSHLVYFVSDDQLDLSAIEKVYEKDGAGSRPTIRG